jgi:hypothetical protein
VHAESVSTIHELIAVAALTGMLLSKLPWKVVPFLCTCIKPWQQQQ